MYTLLFVVTNAHTLLGPFILMLRLLDQALYLDQLYSCTVIMLSHLCRPVWHFAVMGAHTLLSPICSTPWHHLRLLSCAHTVLGSAILLYIYTLVQSLFSLGMWSVNNCTVQLYTRECLSGLWYYTSEPVYWCEITLMNRVDQSQLRILSISGSWGLSSGSWGLYLVHEGYIPVQRGYMFSTRHVDTALLPCRTGCVKTNTTRKKQRRLQ